MWDILGHILFYLILFCGVLLTSISMPGTWVIVVASAVFGLITGFENMTYQLLGGLAIAALALEGIEFLLAVKLAEKMGTGKQASWIAVVGAIVGGIWGTTILPIIGSLIGALGGAFFAAVIWELIQGKSYTEAFKSGRGALIGRGGATIVKTIGAITMVIVIIFV
ncbi:hypothetical protein CEE37_03855 [candidate division LCP-89 bacterium B3_LCP]|uniref:DUF456 domain-containing protein n=1 Tax=candidate division LCP-89 bacterium B3_LCP TaxID=2012998 RepID=A0A532V3B5_UNCL8|nr:MAG: hypothetical protein CEE37_03855 [candidate division LCP-89 bacterium B3_LCP]